MKKYILRKKKMQAETTVLGIQSSVQNQFLKTKDTDDESIPIRTIFKLI